MTIESMSDPIGDRNTELNATNNKHEIHDAPNQNRGSMLAAKPKMDTHTISKPTVATANKLGKHMTQERGSEERRVRRRKQGVEEKKVDQNESYEKHCRGEHVDGTLAMIIKHGEMPLSPKVYRSLKLFSSGATKKNAIFGIMQRNPIADLL